MTALLNIRAYDTKAIVFSDIMYNTIIQNNAIRQMARQIIDAGC